MPINVVCQGIVRFDKETGQYIRCGAEFEAPDALAGKTMRCPRCGDDAAVPATSAAGAKAPSAGGRGTTSREAGARETAPAAVVKAPPPPASPHGDLGFTLDDEPPAAEDSLQLAPSQPFSPWSPSTPAAEPPAAPVNPPASNADDDLYSLSPAEEAPRPTHVHPLAATPNVYQLGEADEAPERAVHSGWCDRCGNDIPAEATICPKCGYQHGMAHVVFRKEPTPPPAMQVCPRCNEQLPPGNLLCEACGYHSGLKQHFPALAKRTVPTNEPPPTGLEQWISRQVEGGTVSPKSAMRWVLVGLGIFLGCCLLTCAGLMFLIFDAWAWCFVVPAVMFFFIAIIVFFAYYKKNSGGVIDRRRKGVEQAIWMSMLMIMRTIGWRSPAPPFERFRSLDVRNTGFGDGDLASLKNLNDYESMDAEGTQLTDAGLPYLAAMPRLRHLCVRRTKVTEQGAWNLQRAKPTLWVWY